MLKKSYRKFFSHAQHRARGYTGNPMRAARLVRAAALKADRRRGFFRDLWADFTSLIRFVRAWARGDYRRMPQRSILFAIAALIYFVSPLDAIPDWIPVLGMIDDATVIAFVINAIRGDLDDFRQWETTGGGDAPIIDVEAS